MFRKLIEKGVEITNIGLTQGYIKADGSHSTSSDADHSKCLVTDFINSGRPFIIELKEGYYFKSYKFPLYTNNGTFIEEDFVSSVRLTQNHYRVFSVMIPPRYMCRATIAKTDGTDITLSDNPVDCFYYIDLQYFDRATKTNSNYNTFRTRLAKHVMVTLRGKTTNLGGRTDVKSTMIGTTYSNCNASAGWVGINTTYRTYVSAVNNAHSVFYTENPCNQITNYGFDWSAVTKTNAIQYYGSVCNSIPNIMRNTQTSQLVESNYKSGTTEQSIASVNELDTKVSVLSYVINKDNGHIYVIIDKLYDAEGNLRFIEYAEQSARGCYAHISMITPESFFNILGSLTTQDYKVYTPKSNATNPYPYITFDNNTDFIASDYDKDATEEFPYNDDICTFLGDYATQEVGEKMYINIKGSNWRTLNIYKVVGSVRTLVQAISITPALDVNGEYWVDQDITSLFSTKEDAGLYEAEATDGTTTTTPTHFEMLWLNCNAYNATKMLSSNYEVQTASYLDKDFVGVSCIKSWPINSQGVDVSKGMLFWYGSTSGSMLASEKTLINTTQTVVNGSHSILQYLVQGQYGNWIPKRVADQYGGYGWANKLYSGIANRTPSNSFDDDGSLLYNSAYAISDYIAIPDGKKYGAYFVNKGAISGEIGYHVCFYDENSTLLSTGGCVVLSTRTEEEAKVNGRAYGFKFEIPSGAKYLRVDMKNTDNYKFLIFTELI